MRSWLRLILLSLVMLGAAWLLANLRLHRVPGSVPITRTLKVGWMDYYPYQYSHSDHGSARREGLGVRLVEAGFHRAGLHPEFVEMTWDRQVQALQAGQLDVVMLASPSPERRKFARFSTPYAAFKLGIYFQRSLNLVPPENPAALAAFCRQHRLRLCLPRGHLVPAPLRPVLAEAAQEGRLEEVDTSLQCLEALYQGRAQLSFVDELVGFYMIRDRHWQSQIGFQDLDCPAAPLCLMFSQKTVSSDTVLLLDQAMDELGNDGTYANLVRTYLYPRVLGVLTQHQLFRIINIAAAIFAGFTGLLIAHREGYDWIGALILASCPAVGGGIMRDLVVSRNPVGVVADPINLVAVACLVAGGGLFFRFAPERWRRRVESMDPSHDPRLLYFDNLGLAAYTVTAVLVAMGAACEPLWLWGPLLAVVQNGGGGIIRDLLLGRGGKIAILRGVIYGEIAFLWALALSLFFILYSQRPDYYEEHMIAAILITMVGVVTTRSLVLARGWKAPLI